MSQQVTPLARGVFAACLGAALVASAGSALGQAKAGAKPLEGQTVKLAWIDPLSGLMAPVGNNQLNSWKFAIDKFNQNNPAGVKFDITGIDNKLSPTESLNALKSATDQGIRYIIQATARRSRWRWSMRSTSTTSATRARR
jgi:branched-chain amino acid transport system substrate-binding protein